MQFKPVIHGSLNKSRRLCDPCKAEYEKQYGGMLVL
jgi:hypothetical protein